MHFGNGGLINEYLLTRVVVCGNLDVRVLVVTPVERENFVGQCGWWDKLFVFFWTSAGVQLELPDILYCKLLVSGFKHYEEPYHCL